VIAAGGGVAFLALALGGQVRGSGIEISTAVVPDGSNAVLTIANFVRIKKFILAQGKRKTYCNMYNDNPFWAFPGVQCVPESAGSKEYQLRDRQVRVQRTRDSGRGAPASKPVLERPGPITQYWRISLDATKKELRVRQDYSKTDPQVLVLEATKYFRAALVEIDRLTGNGESGKQDAAAGK
jgi:hypothetical protein